MYVQVRCLLFDKILHTLWDHYYVFTFGSIHTLTAAHTLVDEQCCLLYPAVLPDRNHDRLFNEFAARTDGGGRGRGYCCSSTGCVGYIWLICAVDTNLLLCALHCLSLAYNMLLLFMTDQWAVYLYRQDISCNQQQ